MTLFERSEYESRVLRAKESMAEKGIDVLLVASPANQFYLTGYDGWSFYTPQMIVVAQDEVEPMWVGRAMDAVGAKFTAYMASERIVPYPDIYVGSAELHPMDFLADLLHEKGWQDRRIGVEMDEYYYTARWHEILTRRLANATFVDATFLVNWLRLTKSPAEIALMKQAGRISEAAMQATLEAAAPGVRQCDAIAELYRVTTSGLSEFGGTFPCKPPNAMAGEYCSAPHLSWTDEPLKEDEIFYIELGGIRHRYHSPLARCIYLGTPPKEITELAQVITEGLEAVLDAVKPGVVLEELAAAWQRTTEKHGVHKDSRLGYPVGIGYPPTWGELTCSIRKGDRTVMQTGMTFHCIPAIWLERYGVVISESFVVTETGAETFADYPRELLTKS